MPASMTIQEQVRASRADEADFRRIYGRKGSVNGIIACVPKGQCSQDVPEACSLCLCCLPFGICKFRVRIFVSARLGQAGQCGHDIFRCDKLDFPVCLSLLALAFLLVGLYHFYLCYRLADFIDRLKGSLAL